MMKRKKKMNKFIFVFKSQHGWEITNDSDERLFSPKETLEEAKALAEDFLNLNPEIYSKILVDSFSP